MTVTTVSGAGWGTQNSTRTGKDGNIVMQPPSSPLGDAQGRGDQIGSGEPLLLER